MYPEITTPGDPTSELMASIIRSEIQEYCRAHNIHATVPKIRVWESPTAFAELNE